MLDDVSVKVIDLKTLDYLLKTLEYVYTKLTSGTNSAVSLRAAT